MSGTGFCGVFLRVIRILVPFFFVFRSCGDARGIRAIYGRRFNAFNRCDVMFARCSASKREAKIVATHGVPLAPTGESLFLFLWGELRQASSVRGPFSTKRRLFCFCSNSLYMRVFSFSFFFFVSFFFAFFLACPAGTAVYGVILETNKKPGRTK